MMGHQCPKRLWLNKHRPELKPDTPPSQQIIFQRGIEVGLLAKDLFPNGTDASPIDHFHFQDAVVKTLELIEGGEEIIYEAAFQHDGVLAVLDILVKKNGKWFAYEVKSSTEVKDTFLADAALQFYVINNSGLSIEDIFIVHINTEYERMGQIDVSNLFTTVSVRKEVLALQKDVPVKVTQLKEVLKLKREPKVDIGPHCHDPYECEFSGHCWRHIPEVSVFDLSRLRADKKFELYEKGIVEIHQIPKGYKLSSAQELQVKAHLENYTHIDRDNIQGWLRDLKYPLVFMDFETFMPAIPLYDKSNPYQHIPFQFSVHIQNERNEELIHYEYLGSPETDPREDFITRLLIATNGSGSVLVYNQAFEAPRLKELKGLFPGLTTHIDKVLERLVDLMYPFQQRWYYTSSMNGSYSIKKVLPALVTNLSYDGLEIGEGGAAMSAFESLLTIREWDEKEKLRRALLEYCKLDTLGMTKILNVLYGV